MLKKKEKNTIVKFIDGSSTNNGKLQNKNIKQNGNFRFTFKDFENDQNIESNIYFRSSFKSEIVSNLTTASKIEGAASPLGKGM